MHMVLKCVQMYSNFKKCKKKCAKVVKHGVGLTRIIECKAGENIHYDVSNEIAIWWRHQMETFSALLVICARNSPVTGEFPAQRPVTLSFDVFFDLRRNTRLSKQLWDWINGWVNNREAGYLRRHRGHHDVIVMYPCQTSTAQPLKFGNGEVINVIKVPGIKVDPCLIKRTPDHRTLTGPWMMFLCGMFLPWMLLRKEVWFKRLLQMLRVLWHSRCSGNRCNELDCFMAYFATCARGLWNRLAVTGQYSGRFIHGSRVTKHRPSVRFSPSFRIIELLYLLYITFIFGRCPRS